MSQVATAPRSVGASDQSGLGSTHALLWLGLGMPLAMVLIGLEGDRAWHATHTFENFYSRPHLFIYGVSALTLARVHRVLEQPRAGDIARLLIWLPIGVPTLTGIVDLLLRHITP